MSAILERLVNQLKARGNKHPYPLAVSILQSHGILKKGSTTLTIKGSKRNSMTPAQRAKSRASKYSGNSIKKYKYSKKTNRATLK